MSIKKMIKNALFVINYASGYDKKLVYSIMGLFVLTKVIAAINDTFLLKRIIEGLTHQKEFSEIAVVLLISMILVIVMEIGNQLLNEWSKVRLIGVSGKIHRDLMEKCGKIDLIYFDNPDFYNTYVTVAGNTDDMVQKAVWVVSKILGSSIALVVASAMIMTIHPIIAIFPIAGFIINLLTRFKIERLAYQWDIDNRKAMRKADYSRRVFYQPEFAKECRLTNVREPLEIQFDEALDSAREAGKKYGPKMTWLSLINWISVFTICSFLAVPAFLGYLALVVKSIALGDVASTNNAANYVRRNLDQVNFCLVDFQQIGQYAEKLRVLLDCKPEIENTVGTKKINEHNKELKLENVSFRYPNCNENTLKNVSLTIKQGEKIAIVGENGVGKTTFVKLLMRLYDVTEGRVVYSGNDIREYNINDYRKEIGAVFQDYNIYATSIGENVLMNDVIEEEHFIVKDALELAGFGERFKKLKNGIDSELTREFSDEGINLSGGESQKVAIARVFADRNNKAIVILDEPSSALDPLSEYKLNQNLIEKAKNSTIVFISHRLSTTRMADKIYLFEKGEIKEQGTHNELMKLNGKYREMFDRQAKNYII